ncbi:MAG: hypothetical protein L0154_28265 [Chloroflexi bacterium]|nr:hypothetical protein [Chloroflexota bacterium]
MRRILILMVLALLLSACGSDDESEIRYSGQISGKYEATGIIRCDRNNVPILGFHSSKEDDPSVVVIYLLPEIALGNHQFSSGNIRGNDILFSPTFDADTFPRLELGDLISGELILTQRPDVDGGWVEGEFDVVYPNMTIEGTFKFRADPNDAPFDCVN